MIRAAKDSDFDDVYEIYTHPKVEKYLARDPGSKESFAEGWRKWMSSPEWLYCDADGGKVVGFMGIKRGKNRSAHVAGMGPLAVHPDKQGKGIGSALFKFALDKIREEGFKKVEFRVHADNDGAVRMYKKFGFEVDTVIKKGIVRYGKEFVDEYQMSLFLDNNIKGPEARLVNKGTMLEMQEIRSGKLTTKSLEQLKHKYKL